MTNCKLLKPAAAQLQRLPASGFPGWMVHPVAATRDHTNLDLPVDGEWVRAFEFDIRLEAEDFTFGQPSL